MGLLDDLKNQVQNLKAKEQQEKQRQEKLQQYYQDEIHPRMVDLYNYLNQLIEHINYIKPETITHFPIKPNKQTHHFKQSGYKLTIDSAKSIKNIALKFICQLDEKVSYELEGMKKIDAQTEVLDSYKVKYSRKDTKDENYKLLSSQFIIDGPIYISVSFVGDVENSAVYLFFNNFEKPGVAKHILKARHLNEEFMDKLGKYILREDDSFLNLDISEEAKQTIRENLAKEREKRQQELAEAERQKKEQQANNKKSIKKYFLRRNHKQGL